MISRYDLVRSERPLVQALLRAYRRAHRFTLPAPRVLVRPVVAVFLALRATYYVLVRVLVCEPFFNRIVRRTGGAFVPAFSSTGSRGRAAWRSGTT